MEPEKKTLPRKPPSPGRLFLLAQAGDQDAWTALVRRYADLLHAAVARSGLAGSDAEEAEQRAWVLLHRHIRAIREPSSVAAWVVTTAVREAARLRQEERRRAELHELGSADAQELPAEPYAIAARLEHIDRVREALDRLGSPCRELLLALPGAAARESYRSVARRLGMALGSVGPTRARCLAKLAALVPELDDG